jgi:acyl carrier protein
MTADPLVERVRALVARMAGRERTPADAGPDTPLAEGGFWLDSVEMMELVVSCEEEFAVVFEGETDLTPETLGTVRSLADLIRSKGAE